MTGTNTDLGQLEPVYTVSDIAAMFRVSRDTVYGWINSGELDAFIPGKRGWRIKKSVADAYYAARGSAASAVPAAATA